MYTKPLPEPDSVSKPFWEATKKHELHLQHCKDCGKYIFYPRLFCNKCLSQNLEWKKVSGRGKVYGFTIIRRPGLPGFEKDVPYVYACVDLEEGPRMTTNVVGIDPFKVTCDMPVQAIFEDVTPEITLVKFKPASA